VLATAIVGTIAMPTNAAITARLVRVFAPIDALVWSSTALRLCPKHPPRQRPRIATLGVKRATPSGLRPRAAGAESGLGVPVVDDKDVG